VAAEQNSVVSILNSSFLIRNYGEADDVPQTWADVTKANKLFGYKPKTSNKEGVEHFYEWWQKQQSTPL
jgi:nucleoside-diphosphate-sugar epimerase